MALSLKEAQAYLDKEAFYDVDQMTVFVTITDVRESWGRLQFEILPIRGEGTKWVNSESVHGIRNFQG
jgi:hypothetical protein